MSGRSARRVLYVQYANPAAYPPLEHSARLLADAGCEVLLLGTEMTSDALRMSSHERIRVALMPYVGPGWRQKRHYLRFTAWVARHARRWRPNWIYASDPLSCPAALMLAATPRARLVYHEHDSPGQGELARSVFMRAVRAARRKIATRAEICVLPNSDRAKAFAHAHPGSHAVVVWNCPLGAEVQGRTWAPASGLRVLYHGSIVPARLPMTVIDAMGQLPANVTLLVAGYETLGHPGYVEALRHRASQQGIDSRIEFVGTVPTREELMRQCATCDVGLALMPLESNDPNERSMVGASNKPFDYMAGGLALVVSDITAWRVTFAQGGFGLTCNPASADSIAAALRRMIDEPEMRVAMGERGQRKIASDWNYERCFAPVISRVTGPHHDVTQRGAA